MPQTNRAVHVAGAWLAVASFLMVAVFVFHGPIAPDLGDQMTRIADGATRWYVVHWIAAGALSVYAVSGFIVLTSGSRLIESSWTMTAWAAVPVASLWTVTTAVAEATVVAGAAVTGARETFEAWWAFAQGNGNGFAFFALAIAAIAANEARSPERATPRWSAWIAAVAGIAAFSGWVLGIWLGVGIGNLLWLVSSILMSLWILWFGLGLMRSRPQ